MAIRKAMMAASFKKRLLEVPTDTMVLSPTPSPTRRRSY